MINLDKLKSQKEAIINFLRSNGPSLPTQISKSIGVSSLFTSAYLSDLKGDNLVKMSFMKVGNSPIYYLPHQKKDLVKFVDSLNVREKEAFYLLKEKKILEDKEQTPVVRVALRAIRDFAVPVKVKTNDGERLFWKFFDLDDDVVKEMVNSKIREMSKSFVEKNTSNNNLKKENIGVNGNSENIFRESGNDSNRKKEVFERGRNFNEKKKEGFESVKSFNENKKEILEDKINSVNENKLEKKGKERKEDSFLNKKIYEKGKIEERGVGKEENFLDLVERFLKKEGVELDRVFSSKKREVEGRVSVGTPFGRQEFFLLAKDKKTIGDNDLIVALQKAQVRKLPALLVSTGDLNKKGMAHLDEWGNLVKFKKIRLS